MLKKILVAAVLSFCTVLFCADFTTVEKGFLTVLMISPPEMDSLPRRVSPEAFEAIRLQKLADSLNLKLKINFVNNLSELLPALREGKGDIAASMLTITPERDKIYNFSTPFYYSNELLITNSENKSFKDIKSLEGKSVAVAYYSSQFNTALQLRKKFKKLNIVQASADATVSDLIEAVGAGVYEYAIVDEIYLENYKAYADDVKSVYQFNEKQKIAWALNRNNEGLLKKVNEFIAQHHTFNNIPTDKRTWSEIKKLGYLRVLVRNNPYTYYLYKGQIKGFEYELVSLFAKKNGLVPFFVVVPEWEYLIPWFNDGKADMIASTMTHDQVRDAIKGIEFCRPYGKFTEQIIGRKSEPVKNLAGLAGRTICVRMSSSYWNTAKKIQDTGIKVNLLAVPENMETFEILDMVASGNYDLTICDSNIADVEIENTDKIQPFFNVGEAKSYGWIVRDGEQEFMKAVDSFFTGLQKSSDFNVIYARYFSRNRYVDDVKDDETNWHPALERFGPLIKKYSGKYGFHWLLVVSQILQESRFDHSVRSSVGGIGLMQLLPDTAKDLGVNPYEPEGNIHGGTKYLSQLRDKKFFDDANAMNKLCFALASYNGGLGHILDARKLASSIGRDPNIWVGNVEYAVRLLSQEKYAKKARYGYCRSDEIIWYVRNIMTKYFAYVQEERFKKPDAPLPEDLKGEKKDK